MAAYGLYTHIASNKFRSMLLLAGLFALVYVLVYAGALVAEVVINGNETVAYYLSRAFTDLLKAAPFATIAAVALDRDRLFLPPVDDRRRHRRRRRHPAGAAAALQSARKSLHLARHHDAEAEDHGEPGAERVRDRPQPAAICRHRHHRSPEGAERPGDRGGARPRAHPHPQRRRAADGGRRDHRRRGRLLRRIVLPAVHQFELEFRRLRGRRLAPRRRGRPRRQRQQEFRRRRRDRRRSSSRSC